MSIFGPATPGPLQPPTPGSTRPARPATRSPVPSAARESDEVDLSNALAPDAIRNLKSNTDEEAKEDRQQQNNYRPQMSSPRPPLDVQG